MVQCFNADCNEQCFSLNPEKINWRRSVLSFLRKTQKPLSLIPTHSISEKMTSPMLGYSNIITSLFTVNKLMASFRFTETIRIKCPSSPLPPM